MFAEKLVQIFSLALGLEETALDDFFKLPFADITINHYPPQAGDNTYNQVLYPHADYGGEYLLPPPMSRNFRRADCVLAAFTLLAQSMSSCFAKESFYANVSSQRKSAGWKC